MTTTPMPEQLDKFCTCDDCKPMECEGCRVNRKRRAAIKASQVQLTDIHSCSFFCGLPACIKRQRDELRDKYVKAIL